MTALRKIPLTPVRSPDGLVVNEVANGYSHEILPTIAREHIREEFIKWVRASEHPIILQSPILTNEFKAVSCAIPYRRPKDDDDSENTPTFVCKKHDLQQVVRTVLHDGQSYFSKQLSMVIGKGEKGHFTEQLTRERALFHEGSENANPETLLSYLYSAAFAFSRKGKTPMKGILKELLPHLPHRKQYWREADAGTVMILNEEQQLHCRGNVRDIWHSDTMDGVLIFFRDHQAAYPRRIKMQGTGNIDLRP